MQMESRGRSAILLKIIALLLAAAGLVCFTATGLSQSDLRERNRQMSNETVHMKAIVVTDQAAGRPRGRG